MGVDDRGLVASLRGDPLEAANAFEVVFDRYAALVHRVAVKWTGHQQDAEDVVSQAFLVVWQRRQEAHLIEASLRPWLLAIAVNVSRNVIRGRRRQGLLLVSAAGQLAGRRDELGATSVEEQVVDRLGVTRDAAVVAAGIDRLPPAEHEVAVLCLLEGLRPQEAAEVLGVPESTVRTRLFRARASLRALLRRSDVTERGDAGGHQQGDRPATTGERTTGARR